LAGALHDHAGERQPLLANVGHVDGGVQSWGERRFLDVASERIVALMK
jgi:hypothetical protein